MTTQITNLADAISVILTQLDSKQEYWFRGHSKTSFLLLPTVMRKNADGYFYNEEKLLREFIRIHPEARKNHTSTAELLTYAQHYGLPTRLLDWSENLLVALFFCCYENIESDGHVYSYNVDNSKPENSEIKFYENLVTVHDAQSVVKAITKYIRNEISNGPSILNRTIKLNDVFIEDYYDMDPFLLYCNLSKKDSFPLTIKSANSLYVNVLTGSNIFYPPQSNQRLKSQKGCFTIHGGKVIDQTEVIPIVDLKNSLKKIADTSPHSALANKKLLKEFIIPSKAKEQILKDLSMCGINKSSLFPELEHQTQSIRDMCIFGN